MISLNRAAFYNAAMAGNLFEDMKRHVGFQEQDVVNLRSMAEPLLARLEGIMDRFYERLFQDPEARQVFSGGEEQLRRQRGAFVKWLRELFCGHYDRDYYNSRLAVGRTHVKVGLSQHYMVTATELLRQEFDRELKAIDLTDLAAKRESLQKLLALETAIMLESYKDSYSLQIRQEERVVAEEKLTRSEHLAELGQLAASLAHEIKNPLAGISGAIQVIRDGMRQEDPHRLIIHEILGQIDRLDAAVKDLLVYARPKPPEFRPCDLRAIITRVLTVMRDAPAFRDLRLRYVSQDGVPPVPADDRQIEQLVMNLLVNAAQASHGGYAIDIELGSVNRKVRLVIRDEGAGMDEALVVRAFEPFFTTKAKGTGLGLPICRRIVEAHDGTIEIHSAIDKGTEVVVELPRFPTLGRTER